MALLPTQSPMKRRLFAAPKPNYQDFSGPPNGDYVRYVEGLMAWAEQEQERLRLKALGDKARATPDAAWGRTASKPATSRVNPPAALPPGQAGKPWEQWVHKAKVQAQRVRQQAVEVAASASEVAATAETWRPKAKPARQSAKGSSVVMWLFGLVFILMILSDLFGF